MIIKTISIEEKRDKKVITIFTSEITKYSITKGILTAVLKQTKK